MTAKVVYDGGAHNQVVMHSLQVGDVEYRIGSWPRGMGFVEPMAGVGRAGFLVTFVWKPIARVLWPQWDIVVRTVQRGALRGPDVLKERLPRAADPRLRMAELEHRLEQGLPLGDVSNAG